MEISHRVIGLKRLAALKVARRKGRAEHVHLAEVAQGAGKTVRVSTVRERKAVGGAAARAVRLARIKGGLRARSVRQIERIGRAWIARA